MPAKLTQEQFNKLLVDRNINYPLIINMEDYNGRHYKIKFKCEYNHIWSSVPNNILNGAGCPICSNKQQKTHQQFLSELDTLNIPRLTKIFVHEGEYISSFIRMSFICDKGHVWKNTPSNIINGQQGCKICSGKMKKTTQQFVEELNIKKLDIKLVSTEKYKTAHTKLLFQCQKGHNWKSRPIDILVGYGCPHCVKKGYSQKSIRWLTELSAMENINIWHAENGGEYLIPNTKFYADGFCIETNTIYEFHGDYWHGNPKIYSPDFINNTIKESMGILYKNTIKRENLLKSLGYNLVIMWESNFI